MIHQTGHNLVGCFDKRNHLIQSTFEQRTLLQDCHVGRKHSKITDWRESASSVLDDAVYNIQMTEDQKTILIGTRLTMNVFDCESGMTHTNKFIPHNITWTMTDLDISDDSQVAISCSLNPYITMYDIQNFKVLFHFNLKAHNSADQLFNFYGLRLYSCKLSADKNSIITGSGKIFEQKQSLIQYFDITKNTILCDILAHKEDINSIAFPCRNSSSVFVSGSDDSLLKLWDIRSLGIPLLIISFRQESTKSLLASSTATSPESPTSIPGTMESTSAPTPKTKYSLSSLINQKSLKLWDLRRISTDQNLPTQIHNYDYRYGKPQEKILNKYRKLSSKEHTDFSVSTFTSHYIVQTLIRCHFSPLLTTNSEFIITGSACGAALIYSIMDPSRSPIAILPNEKMISQTAQLDADNPVGKEEEEREKQEMNKEEGKEEEEEEDQNYIVRDCIWTENSIITGDFGGNVRQFNQF